MVTLSAIEAVAGLCYKFHSHRVHLKPLGLLGIHPLSGKLFGFGRGTVVVSRPPIHCILVFLAFFLAALLFLLLLLFLLFNPIRAH